MKKVGVDFTNDQNYMQSVQVSPKDASKLAKKDEGMMQLSERSPTHPKLKKDKAGAKGAARGDWIEGSIEPKESSVNKSNTLDSEDVTRRNFYLTLFRLYASIPFKDCISSFTKIFNDVFIHERPSTVHKYSLTEV